MILLKLLMEDLISKFKKKAVALTTAYTMKKIT
jgi:hypothetical protein